jgi:hypothetical protein
MAALGSIGFFFGGSLTEHYGVRTRIKASVYETDTPLTVSGVIHDDTGAESARTVRIYDRATGHLIGETTSDAGDGTYSLAAPSLDDVPEVQRIALDDDAGTLYNDIIDRVEAG